MEHVISILPARRNDENVWITALTISTETDPITVLIGQDVGANNFRKAGSRAVDLLRGIARNGNTGRIAVHPAFMAIVRPSLTQTLDEAGFLPSHYLRGDIPQGVFTLISINNMEGAK